LLDESKARANILQFVKKSAAHVTLIAGVCFNPLRANNELHVFCDTFQSDARRLRFFGHSAVILGARDHAVGSIVERRFEETSDYHGVRIVELILPREEPSEEFNQEAGSPFGRRRPPEVVGKNVLKFAARDFFVEASPNRNKSLTPTCLGKFFKACVDQLVDVALVVAGDLMKTGPFGVAPRSDYCPYDA
jgi:hypothetical protein